MGPGAGALVADCCSADCADDDDDVVWSLRRWAKRSRVRYAGWQPRLIVQGKLAKPHKQTAADPGDEDLSWGPEWEREHAHLDAHAILEICVA